MSVPCMVLVCSNFNPITRSQELCCVCGVCSKSILVLCYAATMTESQKGCAPEGGSKHTLCW